MAIDNILKEKQLTAIIKGCISNDRKSQERLYRHFFATMERTVRRYTQDDDKVISILNNGFLKAFKNIHKYEHKGSFEGWLRKIIFRSMSDYMRSESRDVKFLVFEEYDRPTQIDSESRLFFDDLISIIHQLPEMQEKVFVKHAIEGYKHSEIAQLYDINENTSRWYLGEARKALRIKLEKMNKDLRDVG